jgi:site-specific DNA-methyltransferase (cytosine-N4-specific)
MRSKRDILFVSNYRNKIVLGNALDILRTIPDNTFRMAVTSPPYWGIRDYGREGQIGLEETVEEYVDKLLKIFNEVKRVLTVDGTFWLNIADVYATQPAGNKTPSGFSQTRPSRKRNGIGTETVSIPVKRRFTNGVKLKDLVGISWMLAFAMQKTGWYVRSDIIWDKIHPMPESVTDRPTNCYEHLFLLTKSNKYWYNEKAIRETSVDGNGTKNKRNVWRVWKKPFKHGSHFATFPEELIEPCILAGSEENDIVLDMFMGSGTVAVVAKKYKRNYFGIELNQEYLDIANRRLDNE